MKQLLVVILAVILFTACDEKEIKLYPTIAHSASTTIADDGNFYEEITILASEINQGIGDLDYDDASIDDVVIEGVWINVKRLDKNEADNVKLQLTINTDENGMSYILKDFMLDIPEDEKEIFLPNYLQKEGVDALHMQLKNIIINEAANSDIKFVAEGVATPDNSFINIELTIHVKGTIVFSQTLSLGE